MAGGPSDHRRCRRAGSVAALAGPRGDGDRRAGARPSAGPSGAGAGMGPRGPRMLPGGTRAGHRPEAVRAGRGRDGTPDRSTRPSIREGIVASVPRGRPRRARRDDRHGAAARRAPPHGRSEVPVRRDRPRRAGAGAAWPEVASGARRGSPRQCRRTRRRRHQGTDALHPHGRCSPAPRRNAWAAKISRARRSAGAKRAATATATSAERRSGVPRRPSRASASAPVRFRRVRERMVAGSWAGRPEDASHRSTRQPSGARNAGGHRWRRRGPPPWPRPRARGRRPRRAGRRRGAARRPSGRAARPRARGALRRHEHAAEGRRHGADGQVDRGQRPDPHRVVALRVHDGAVDRHGEQHEGGPVHDPAQDQRHEEPGVRAQAPGGDGLHRAACGAREAGEPGEQGRRDHHHEGDAGGPRRGGLAERPRARPASEATSTTPWWRSPTAWRRPA